VQGLGVHGGGNGGYNGVFGTDGLAGHGGGGGSYDSSSSPTVQGLGVHGGGNGGYNGVFGTDGLAGRGGGGGGGPSTAASNNSGLGGSGVVIVRYATAGGFSVTEDVASNLLFPGTPFADGDSATLTVTLTVSDGTITGNSGAGVVIGGTATARTFTGTIGNLNTYFTTAGKITYLGAANNTADRTLTTMVTDDGGGTASTTSPISFTAVNDAPVLEPITDSYAGAMNQPQTVPLLVADIETATPQLVVTARSSNQTFSRM
jgi:hypothetical protein